MTFSTKSPAALFLQRQAGGPSARLVKRLIAGPRYRQQLAKARQGYAEHGREYLQSTLFVAGLPKSGTTWLESMLTSMPGFYDVMLPEAVAHEQRVGESISFDLPTDAIDRLDKALAVLKLHLWASEQTVRVLETSGINYVAIYRDLRDVAVSHTFYVQRTPWHPEHDIYRKLTTQQALEHFADVLLPMNVQWVRSWRRQAKVTDRCLVVRYEEMLADGPATLGRVLKHFRVPNWESVKDTLIEQNSFERLSGGAKRGEDNSGFFRKGVAGDWVNHMSGPLADRYALAMEEAEAEV